MVNRERRRNLGAQSRGDSRFVISMYNVGYTFMYRYKYFKRFHIFAFNCKFLHTTDGDRGPTPYVRRGSRGELGSGLGGSEIRAAPASGSGILTGLALRSVAIIFSSMY